MAPPRLQLKGAGRTPFSRDGDGRAALGPVLREYVVSEAMAALGIPTTRALAAVRPVRACAARRCCQERVLTRIASSHIRIGTFQFFAARNDHDALRQLADHVIKRHYPISPMTHSLTAPCCCRDRGQAELIAQWMQVGFIHGVMNTDNMSIAGETIDYGPCAFMDTYDPSAVFSSIDQNGRYAYGNQPRIALWNLTRFAECLLPLLPGDDAAAVETAKAALSSFVPAFDGVFSPAMRAKCGLSGAGEEDDALVADFLELLAVNKADYTLAFRRLCDAADDDASGLRAMFTEPAGLDGWLVKWRQRRSGGALDSTAMRRVNPAFIPRNHRVEAAIEAALRGDFAPFEQLHVVLAHPFDDQPAFAGYAEPPQPDERVTATFCGT